MPAPSSARRSFSYAWRQATLPGPGTFPGLQPNALQATHRQLLRQARQRQGANQTGPPCLEGKRQQQVGNPHFGKLSKGDLLQMFEDLFKGDLPIFNLNFGVITLISKEADLIQQYRPICLLNVSFKIFTKVSTIRLISIADHVIIHVRASSWKALFQTKKGIRQGDRLSLLLFNIVANVLAIVVKKAKNNGQRPYLVDGGLSLWQNADDTILFMEHDMEKARNMKLLLCSFEQVSGLKINFHKSQLYYFGAAHEALGQYMEIIGCGEGEFPFNYLGILIDFKRLRNSDWRWVFRKNSITSSLDFFGKGMNKKGNIISLSRVCFVYLRTKAALGSMIWA
ncbi:LOW QUALITY PROTEIN: hypothetical protein U9M48_014157 [Paspalum notatum var. saurae]|uniref:Reverse transcriptase domain-containing protein n=1 Tax=Paspalum notatum var. saurae TaxID=547442 RepID=A0AAQ3WK85_PASNO